MEALRAKKAARTRSTILNAALGLFESYGYSATSVGDIASAAEISLPTLFRYFPSKADLVFADDEVSLLRWEAAFDGCDPRLPLSAALRAASGAVIAGTDLRLASLRARLLQEDPELEQRALWGDARALERATLRIAGRCGWDPALDLRPALVARATLGAMRAAQGLVRAGSPTPFLSLVDQAFVEMGRMGELLETPRVQGAD